MRLAFVCGLNDKKLAQKLAPLQSLSQVGQIDLYRRRPFEGDKVRWMGMPRLCSAFAPLGDPWRFASLVARAGRYDALIGCHQRYHGVYAAVAGALRRRKVIQLVITDPDCVDGFFLGAWSLRQSSAIGCRGQRSRALVGQRFGTTKPCFVPHNVWAPAGKTSSAEKTIDLLYVGNQQRDKNLDAWLEVAAATRRRRGALRALMVGDLPPRRLASRVRRLGLSEALTFAGPMYGERLGGIYDASRVLLLTSRWEGLPMVALEAMSHGLPVVAPRVGDLSDLIVDGRNGFLTGVEEVEGAAAAVGRLLEDPELYRRMARAARETVADFVALSTLEHARAAWLKVFREIGVG